ncbi:general stress protein [Phenylobacterium sp.]|uniref:general stress protein n=1 Tax=Phenylobacterium sp. TaxID=1871053 RepID=UPI002737F32E|nr:KGG domain-containing protein [Phenylobacterium sp.]MDP3869141.1 KGG domain-containing protein [Phenylobacterium sp.]
MTEATTKARRGFAAMSPEKRLEIARRGGKAVRPENRSFAKNRDLAASAGRKGGEAYCPSQAKVEG